MSNVIIDNALMALVFEFANSQPGDGQDSQALAAFLRGLDRVSSISYASPAAYDAAEVAGDIDSMQDGGRVLIRSALPGESSKALVIHSIDGARVSPLYEAYARISMGAGPPADRVTTGLLGSAPADFVIGTGTDFDDLVLEDSSPVGAITYSTGVLTIHEWSGLLDIASTGCMTIDNTAVIGVNLEHCPSGGSWSAVRELVCTKVVANDSPHTWPWSTKNFPVGSGDKIRFRVLRASGGGTRTLTWREPAIDFTMKIRGT